VLGSPIRTPWDHSSVDNSPRPIAASHVLHRLLVPRHPPCALSNLTTNHTTTPKGGHRRSQKRCSHPLCNSQQTHNHHHNQPANTQPIPKDQGCRSDPGNDRPRETPTEWVVFSGPNRVFTATTNRIPTRPFPTHPVTQRGPTRSPKPLSVVTRQCLRHRAPPPHIREWRAPTPLSREGAP
jgi:hypothetical protein